VRLHLVEALSGHLATMLNARQLDIAVMFNADAAGRWSVAPLLDEELFLIAAPDFPGRPSGATVKLAELAALPLILPSSLHGLRTTLATAFATARITPNIVAEIDGLALLMDAVSAGLGATIQPGAAVARAEGRTTVHSQIIDAHVTRRNLLVSFSDDELSPAGLAARVVVAAVATEMVQAGRWPGASLHRA
jgi:LysR family tcuABC transcriptional regulator